MKLSEFHYELPAGRIAQEPLAARDHSRLLVVQAKSGLLEHRQFFEIAEFLRPGDVLVMNAARVSPARLRGKKKTGGKVEVLLLDGDVSGRALVRGATQPGDLLFPEGMTARMEKRLDNGEWMIRFSRNSLRSYLDRHGEMPLPPYIKRPAPASADRDRYQTVYAKTEGAVAAPTAGFHFTPELLDRLKARGVQPAEIVLHVGWGTFRPVRTETVEDHTMLPERFDVPAQTARLLSQARAEGKRLVAVGTTVVRTLESICRASGEFAAGPGETNLYIYPGYAFKAVDALVTNFHLPDSTPLLLASAFLAHKTKSRLPFPLRAAYEEAIRRDYRFYSYGDAMLIV